MFAIVVSHVVLYLRIPGGGGISESFVVDYSQASPEPRMWLLVLLRWLGRWGNTVFVICSAWFLCRSTSVRWGKVVRLVLDAFAISFVFLLAALVLGLVIPARTFITCLMPTTFGNNWFITCYLLLYLAHPAFNWVVERLGKRGTAVACVRLVFFYMVIPIFTHDKFFWSQLMFMVTTYFIVAYMRLWMKKTCANTRANLSAFLGGTVGMIILVVLTELARQCVSALSGAMLRFDIDGNPFITMSVLGFFNLMRSRPFLSIPVNSAASNMLYVYLIHDNVLVRTYLLPAIWLWIYGTLGYSLLVMWVFVLAALLFLSALVLGFLYRGSLGRLAARLVAPVGGGVRRIAGFFINRLCSLE